MTKTRPATPWKKDYLRLESVHFFVLFLSGLAGLVALVIWLQSPSLSFNPYLKLSFFVLLLFVCGGQQVVSILLRAQWYNSMSSVLSRFFFSQPENQYKFYKLEVPPNYNYNLDQLKNFFKYLHFAHKFRSYTVERGLNLGVTNYAVVFDIVVQKSSVSLYLAFATQFEAVINKALEYYLPGIRFEVCENPLENMPKEWNDSTPVDGYECVAGNALGYTLSNVFYSNRINQFEPKNFPLNSIIRNIQDNLKDQKVFLQYILSFENLVDTAGIKTELKSFRQQSYNRFSLKNLKPNVGSEITGILLPDEEKKRFNDMDERISIQREFVSANIKVLALSSAEQYIETENLLEQAFRSNSKKARKDSNEIEKIHLTSTNQRYYNLSEKVSPISIPYMHDTFWFPPTWLEPFVSNLYDNVYYYNENRYRRQAIYRSFVKRSALAPWRSSNTLLDFDTLPSVFQIPTGLLGHSNLKSLDGLVKVREDLGLA